MTNKAKSEEFPDTKVGSFLKAYQTTCKKLPSQAACESLLESLKVRGGNSHRKLFPFPELPFLSLLKVAIQEEKTELDEFLLDGKEPVSI